MKRKKSKDTMEENSENRKNPNEEFLEAESKGFGDAGRIARKDDDFISKARQKEFVRSEERMDTFHSLLIRALKILFWVAVVVLAIRAWHLIGFECLVWLGENKLNAIDKIFVGALGGGLIGRYLQSIFPEKSS